MDLNQFKKLEDSIKQESFNKEYKNINGVMFALSIFGHISSIFLAYFFLSKIFSGAITENPFVVLIASLSLLSGLELLKRDIFQKFSSASIKIGSILHKNIYPLLFLSVAVVSLSFYASISGAKEFASKEKDLQVVAQNNVQKYEDSLKNIYNVKIQEIETEQKNIKTKIDTKDQEQTSLESMQPLTSSQRNRVRDLKSEKDLLRADLINNDSSISKLKTELSQTIKQYESEINQTTGQKKDENKTNTVLFVIISTLVEFIILAGVYFNRYYKIRSYNEFRVKIEKDPNYQKWILFSSIIDCIYSFDTKINDKAPSTKTIIELSKLNGNIILQKDANDFIKILTSLGILRTSGGAKYFLKSKETAKEIIKEHFNIT
jgi:hypothetical protein